jgi:hypothetical protein
MSEFHERFIDGLFEARWQPGAQPEFHRGENKQSCLAEEGEADKMEHIVIELTRTYLKIKLVSDMLYNWEHVTSER